MSFRAKKIKWILIIASSLVSTLLLFFTMAKLIANNHDLSKLKSSHDVIEFSMNRLKSQLQQKKRQLPKKQKVIKPPDFKPLKPIAIPLSNLVADTNISDLIGDFGLNEGGIGSEVTPIVRINPQYPIQAAMKKIEGWVIIQFDITPSGNVTNAKVIKYHPSPIFNKSAIQAVVRWKYKPKIENGKSVSQLAVKTQLDFKLE